MSLLHLLKKTTFNNPQERHEVNRQLTYDVLKKRLYVKDVTQEEKELIKKRLEEHQIL